METIEPNFNISAKKGAVGERIVRGLLEKQGWIVYQPLTEGPHLYDILAVKDKEKALVLDVKAKARMKKRAETGIDKSQYEEYKNFSLKYSMPFWLVFVDEMEKRIYGNTLEELEKECVEDGQIYPHEIITKYNKKVVMWPLSKMKHFANLTEDDVIELKKHNRRNYDYK
jgi:Holliday junction resolvase